MAFNISNMAFTLSGFLIFLILIVKASGEKNCDCPGPRKYYSELGCTPVFSSPEACCPIRYNCDHLKNLSLDKCYVNGHIYDRDDPLRGADKTDHCASCRCIGPGFECRMTRCAGPRPNCYIDKKIPTQCCGSEVCFEKEADIPTCVVDGKKYKAGEFFIPSADPGKRCYCNEQFTGAIVGPSCQPIDPPSCTNLIYNADNVRRHAVPYYSANASLEHDCNMYLRYPTSNDVIIRRSNATSTPETNEPEDSNMICKYGNLRMRIGDMLNYTTNDGSIFYPSHCVCNVPPVPTCRLGNP